MEHISSILPRVIANMERRRPACWQCSRFSELRRERIGETDRVFWYCPPCRRRLTYNGLLYQPTDTVRMDEIEHVGAER